MTSSVFTPAKLGPITLKNRVIKAATFEGVTRDGQVSQGLIDYHLAPALGGVAMTTVAYLAVSPEGRTDSGCLVIDDERAEQLRALTTAIHTAGAKVAAQIGHAGPVANPASNRASALSPSGLKTPSRTPTQAITTEQITRITKDYAMAALRVADAGFDSVEIHLGHNYLLSSFLSPKLNRRSDSYGGSLENRARFALEVVDGVRNAVDDRLAVTAKINMEDGVKGGFCAPESIVFAQMLEQSGNLDALELTGGSSLANPMWLFRGNAPRKEFAQHLPRAMRMGFKLVGWKMMPSYPFSEAYFLPLARQFREALSMPLILLGGINKLETAEAAIAEGFDFVAMGRALLREPDLVNRMEAGETAEGLCIHCNRCMPTIYTGTRCVERQAVELSL